MESIRDEIELEIGENSLNRYLYFFSAIGCSPRTLINNDIEEIIEWTISTNISEAINDMFEHKEEDFDDIGFVP